MYILPPWSYSFSVAMSYFVIHRYKIRLQTELQKPRHSTPQVLCCEVDIFNNVHTEASSSSADGS